MPGMDLLDGIVAIWKALALGDEGRPRIESIIRFAQW